MARNLSATSLAKLATQYGTEPIVIIEIQWVDGGERTAYSDRDIDPGVKGAILDVGGLDDVVQVSGGSQSQQISFTLDDTDGTIKAIMDSQDMHKRPCWVYQYFDGIPVDDKFLIFKGVLNSPISWDEGGRTIKFDVISKIEDVEVGFSIEEGDFVNPPEELIGKPWPLCFGTVINVPALKASTVKRGILATGTGIRDFTLERRLDLAEQITCPDNFEGFKAVFDGGVYNSIHFEPVYSVDAGCAKSRCEAIELLELQITEQRAHEISPVRIFGGNKFPQGVSLVLNINGGKFIGTFSGEIFTITGRVHPDNDGHGNVILTDTQATIQSACPGSNVDASDITDEVPGESPVLGAGRSKLTWQRFNDVKAANFFWANAGSTVAIDGDEEILYIANLLPSTVLRVAAYRELNGGRQLLTVPAEYYEIRETDYTGYPGVCEIAFSRPLSGRDLENGGGWSDDIYVTLTSSVGPNTVAILEWFIETYTEYDTDATSFDAVRTLIDNYPMHFPLLERKNLINVLQEIAYQARCALWLKDDTFYIKYLSLEPDADDTVTESDVLANSLVIEHTPTEDLITKYVATWRKDYAIDKPNTVILRHNVRKYGTHKGDFNYYCFNILELVRKTATFWLIRRANTWRRAIFRTPISKLNLETFDTVALTLPDAVTGTVKCVVEKANYNSDSKTIDFEVWTPCKAGTKVAYDFAWPAAVDETLLFPTIEERTLGLAGSGHQPNFSVIAPFAHPLSYPPEGGLFSGFNTACNGDPVVSLSTGECRPDHGNSRPSDINDTKPVPDASSDQAGEISSGTSPITNDNSSCCQAAMAKADQALKEAQQARTEAQGGVEHEGSDSDLNDDEDPDELAETCGGSCSATIRIQYLTPTTVARPPGSEEFLGSDPGDTGRVAVGDEGVTKCHTFNSATLANEFANAKQAEIDARTDGYGWTVGKSEAWLIFRDLDLGNDEEGNPCPEPAAEDRAMTGFTITPAPE